jgi:hypothetical protein
LTVRAIERDVMDTLRRDWPDLVWHGCLRIPDESSVPVSFSPKNLDKCRGPLRDC